MKPEIREAIKKTAAVSSMPQVVTRFLDLIQDPDFSYDELVTVLSSDPGTAAEILRLANSALFGLSRKVTNLRPALTLLGPRRVRALVLGRFLVESVGRSTGDLDDNYYWRRSLACGVVATRFAEVLTPRMREEAFIAALLADVGVTILAQEVPEHYAPVVAQYCPNGAMDISTVEEQAIECTHAEVSSWVLEHWRLPELVCEAVRLHHSDVETTGASEQLARIINAADVLAKMLCESPDVGDIVRECHRAVDYIHVSPEVLYDVLEKVEADMAELSGLLRLGIVPNSSYSLIIQTLRTQAVC